MRAIVSSLLLLLGFVLTTSNARCQLYVGGRNINDSARIKIIQVDAIDNTVYAGAHRYRYYSIEWGEQIDIDEKQVTDEKGNRLPLRYPLAVANYIAARGWKLVQVQYYRDMNTPYCKYTFAREEKPSL